MKMRRTIHRVSLIAASMTVLTACAMAQDGTITADPNAVTLRKIWEVAGNTAGGDYVGYSVGGIGDIYGTGYGVWYVTFGTLGEQRYYVADSSGHLPSWTEPVYTVKGMGDPIIGDYWKSGHKVLVFQRGTQGGIDENYYELHAFRTD